MLNLTGAISVNIYRLYVKTHKITGLKYLGMTTQQNYSKYDGSGLHWKRHLAVHGKDHTTEIINEFSSLTELKEGGLYYSQLWSVVESQEWANIIPESGEGVIPTPEIIKRRTDTRKKNKMDGTVAGWTDESTIKCNSTKIKNGTMNTRTPENIAAQLKTRVEKGTDPSSPSVIAKCRETKRKNGTVNNFIENNPALIKVECPHCGIKVGKGLFARWHGENCKAKK